MEKCANCCAARPNRVHTFKHRDDDDNYDDDDDDKSIISGEMDDALDEEQEGAVENAVLAMEPNIARQRESILALRASFVRNEIFTICVALQSLRLSVLELLTIVDAVAVLARYAPMHLKWKMICCIRHHDRDKSIKN